MKAWKGCHLNVACIAKPKLESNVEVLRTAEAIYKVSIFNIFEMPEQASFVENNLDDDDNRMSYKFYLPVYCTSNTQHFLIVA